MVTSPQERAAQSFAAVLERWRAGRGLTKKDLAARMGFDPSYVSHVERGRHRPTADFARRAELVLQASGEIWGAFQAYQESRSGTAGTARLRSPGQDWLPPGTGLVIDREIATLAYREGGYVCTVRRVLYNAGTEPVVRYLIRVAVDRYPHDPARSSEHHRAYPLSLGELGLRAWCGEPPAAEPMRWRPKHDRDAFKEIWLLFENEHGRFPLYPGERTVLEYSYRVGADKWGPWFQRAVRLPTRHLTVRLDLPAAVDPQVWGVETSLSAGEVPLRTPVTRHLDGDRAVFEWTTQVPPLSARYRLEWRFRADPVSA